MSCQLRESLQTKRFVCLSYMRDGDARAFRCDEFMQSNDSTNLESCAPMMRNSKIPFHLISALQIYRNKGNTPSSFMWKAMKTRCVDDGYRVESRVTL
jgi:hypothetical protein